jgi:hypothetical protein
MLRPNKFRAFETKIVLGIGLLLLVFGTTGGFLALQRTNWRLGLASAGIVGLAGVYVWAAIRGRPL